MRLLLTSLILAFTLACSGEPATDTRPQGPPIIGAAASPESYTPVNTPDPVVGGTAGAQAPVGVPMVPEAGMPDPADPVIPPPRETLNDDCERPGSRDPLVARDGEVCHNFLTHGVSSPTDTTKFRTEPGESYHEFYYDIPWNAGDVMTRFGADFDNETILHHYLFFSTNANKPNGQVDRNVLGTTFGTGAKLLAGWAVGGCGQEMPDQMGFELPNPGQGMLMNQWHLFNSTGSPQEDGSTVQICVAPAGSRENVGGITFLGTENFNGPVGMAPGEQSFTSECTNNSGQDVTVVGWNPHMHTIGNNMKTDIRRVDGSLEEVFNRPFQFDYQVSYAQDPLLIVKPGETLVTTCSFLNDTGGNVPFGQSTNQEMCYQFVSYYPVGALDNGTPSLIGALNTCW
jgi:hypothetical protein